MSTAISGSAAALLDDKIKQAAAEVRALDHALQLSYGYGDYRHIQACKDAWQLAFTQLNRLMQQRRRSIK